MSPYALFIINHAYSRDLFCRHRDFAKYNHSERQCVPAMSSGCIMFRSRTRQIVRIHSTLYNYRPTSPLLSWPSRNYIHKCKLMRQSIYRPRVHERYTVSRLLYCSYCHRTLYRAYLPHEITIVENLLILKHSNCSSWENCY